MTIEELAQFELVCFDTAPLIYFVENNPAYVDVIQAVIDVVDSGATRAVASVITLTEVLVQPLRIGDVELEIRYREMLADSEFFQLVSVDSEIAAAAALLRAKYNLRTPDALQVATAMSTKCNLFITNDKDLRRITEIQVVTLDDIDIN